MAELIQAKAVISGKAAGEALVSSEPLSFWGGYDQRTGEIIDRRHPLSGQLASGRVLVIPYTRGSSTTTAVLLEALRAGTAPSAIVTTGQDTFLALGALVAHELYGHSLPILAVSSDSLSNLRTGQWLEIAPNGTISITGGQR
jgi:predicted aconitase with swiveling domain